MRLIHYKNIHLRFACGQSRAVIEDSSMQRFHYQLFITFIYKFETLVENYRRLMRKQISQGTHKGVGYPLQKAIATESVCVCVYPSFE